MATRTYPPELITGALAEPERLRLALAAAAEGIVLSDEQGRVLYQNETASRLLNASPARALAKEAVERVLREAASGREATQTLDLFGPPRQTLSISARPYRVDGVLSGGIAVVEDVSEKRRLEAVRRDFVANITHELKTPIGALALLADTLAGEEDPEIVNRLAGRIQAEAQRVARIMDDLLDLSRIESEELPAREPLSVHFLVNEAVERVRAAADQRGVALAVFDLPGYAEVVGDRRQLVSAIYNLLENAVKYSDEDSTVEVRTGAAWNDGIEVVVRDHGIGIAATELDRIFERFYRVDKARARDTGGTGLGLAIVRHVVGNHGGEVTVTSCEGQGSTFTLRLPGTAAPYDGDDVERG